MQRLGQLIRERALELGFDCVGIAPAGEAPHASDLRRWLAAGHQADMAWMERNEPRRIHPGAIVSGARSIIMAGFNYALEDPPPALREDPLRGRIARYAWGADYHHLLLPRLMTLAEFIRQKASGNAKTRAYVDTGPLLEKPWAATAGLGFVGRNTLLIHPEKGSYLFLGGIITDVALEYDEPAANAGATQGKGTCGNCRRCLDVCPTHAFPAAYILDSNRCISYLTIELKGAIPPELRSRMGNWIYGCDACQEICPWVRRFSQPAPHRFLEFDASLHAPDLMELMTLDDAAFNQRYKGTPIKRAKRRGLLRNAAVALGNAADPAALPVLRRALQDPEPLIRDHAAWAIERIECGQEVSR